MNVYTDREQQRGLEWIFLEISFEKQASQLSGKRGLLPGLHDGVNDLVSRLVLGVASDRLPAHDGFNDRIGEHDDSFSTRFRLLCWLASSRAVD